MFKDLSGIMSHIGQLEGMLQGLSFPISKQQLVDFARSRNASPTIMSLLDRIPEKQYQNQQEVTTEVSNAAPAAAATPAPAQ